MIEKLNEKIDSIDYFGGEESPQYKSIAFPQNESLYDVLMVESIMKEFESICGYISDNKFHYYELKPASYSLDFSKEEVVVFVWNAELKDIIHQHSLFNFLSSVCKKVWFINHEGYVNFTKTAATYHICSHINAIFEDFSFYRIFIDTVIMNKSEETLFDLLDIINVYNDSFHENANKDWKNNYEDILMKEFMLTVTKGVC